MILVTGGTGMTGSFIVRELQHRGKQVRVLTREESRGKASALGIEVAVGNLEDKESLHRAYQGVTGIVHVATTFPEQKDVDIAAMQTLVETWDEGAFIFISSVDVYGRPDPVSFPVTEKASLRKGYSDYADGKIRCEELLVSTAEQKGRRDFSILRPPHIWGPTRRYLEKHTLAELYQTGKQDAPIVLPGETEQEWSTYGDAWVDTCDLAWAVAECLDKPLGHAMNIITGHFCWHDVCAELIQFDGQ